MPPRDPHDILGVPRGASAETVRQAYRRLAARHHPDRCPDDPAATARFQEIRQAYEALQSGSRAVDFDDLFGSVFGTPPSHAPDPIPPRRVIDLDFETAALGGTVVVDWPTPHVCRACAGMGGVCPLCAGSGRVWKSTPLPLRIPPGVDTGDRLEIDLPDAPDAVVRVRPHPRLERCGHDVACTAVVRFTQALLGAVLRLPTLDGTDIEVVLPPGTAPGTVLRIRGRGIPVTPTRRGDMLCRIAIDMPQSLTEEQRRQAQRLDHLLAPKATRRASRARTRRAAPTAP